ncbi:MAG: double zinc ribbon domain-containing protein [Candidatus Rickettsia vulgarisii]
MRIINIVSKIYHYIIDYILPPRCLSCCEMTNSTEDFCANCWRNLNFISKPYCIICGRRFDISILHGVSCNECLRSKPHYDNSRSLMKFDEHSKRIIHAFKYKDKTVLAKTFAKLLYKQYHQELRDIDWITPVPMNRFKRLFRMYNLPFLLAIEIGKLLKIQVVPDILIKSKWAKSQTYLFKRAREKNLAGSLILNKKYQISGKKILLMTY